MNFPSLRPRRTAETVVSVPGYARAPHIQGSLAQESAAEISPAGFWHFHLGDIITQGAANWALDPSHDTPLSTIWGHGVMRNPSAFAPTTPQIVYAHNAAPLDAIRGMIYQGIAPSSLHALQGGTESFNG